MDLAGYATERRPKMTAGELVGLFAIRAPGKVPTPEAAAVLAECLEAIDDDVLAGWVADASELAGDLDMPADVRRLAAALAAVAESILTDDALADWDRVLDLIDAAISVGFERRPHSASERRSA
jgi:hypothetical protein